jgi:hypothetical protein
MEISQGNSLCSILNKNVIFFLLQNQGTQGRTVPVGVRGLVSVGRRRKWGKGLEGEYSINTVYICMKMEK